MKAQRAEVRAKLQPHREEERRRRRRILMWLALLILLLLLSQCECVEPPEPLIAPVPMAGRARDAGPRPEVAPQPKKKSRRRPKLKTKKRPKYKAEPPKPESWLPGFKLQVAARGPRLAACFQGAEAPGALKWTAAVDPPRGVVSDHLFEPTLGGVQLTRKLRRCLTHVLSKPPYRLPGAKEGQARVSIVIEF